MSINIQNRDGNVNINVIFVKKLNKKQGFKKVTDHLFNFLGYLKKIKNTLTLLFFFLFLN